MKTGMLLHVCFALLLSPGAVSAQESRISWFGFSSGFAVSGNGTMHAMSLVGQGFAGPMQSQHFLVEGGFLADTLLRGTMTDVPGFDENPRAFALYQNFPNPFNPRTWIRYDLPGRLSITITVYNILGQRVRTLLEEVQDAGRHEVEFDAGGLASGVYFCRLTAGGYAEMKKLILLR